MHSLSSLFSAVFLTIGLLSYANCSTAAPPKARQQAAPASFHTWVQSFAHEARAAGISEATLQATLGQVRWQPRVIELDRAQPEFIRPPWVYLDNAVSPLRVQLGRKNMQIHASVLETATRRFGVPSSIITAIWGMESNYGRHFGGFRTVDALATLAWEGRRREWARKELLAALRIVERGDVAATAMIGSWAGAMGHTQFLPSVFLTHAVDGDGDGRRDIWNSIPDALASTAHFLAQAGWQSNEVWGVEVRLPTGFDWARAAVHLRQSSTAWATEGVQPVRGQRLPMLSAASILLPAGARGPAFLVGHNFHTLLRYNNSLNYALAVGLLAQQLDGHAPVQAPWPRNVQPLSRTEVKALQTALNARGIAVGSADGVIGPATRAGLRRYQHSVGLPTDGFATRELLQHLTQKGS